VRRGETQRHPRVDPDVPGYDDPFSTYECVVFRLEDGRVAEQTTYVNWLDAYVQTGMLDLAPVLG
jgi:hypothetical protein